jgi:phosphomannomutase
MTDIRFGTDGWRGRIAEDYTYDNVRRCAQGFASYMQALGKGGESLVVGYDRRFSSEHFAAAVAEVLAANGFRALLTEGATPTPVISYAVVSQGAAGAINVTASHNPPWDNGFKVRNEFGGAIPPDGLAEIEQAIPGIAGVKRVALEEALASGTVAYFDPAPAYLAQLARLIDVQPIKDAGLTVLVDVMWGNGAGWFPRILGGGSTRIIEIHAERNPIFPEMSRPEPIPPNVDVGLAKVREVGADVAIINDEDHRRR